MQAVSESTVAEANLRLHRDALPEQLDWRDDGCEVAPACLECPLPRCRYDEPGGLRGLLNESRDAEVLQARSRGQTIGEIATRFDISRRSVFRILRRGRAPDTARPRPDERRHRRAPNETKRRER